MGNNNFNCTGVYNEEQDRCYIGDHKPDNNGQTAHQSLVNKENLNSKACYGYSYHVNGGAIKSYNSGTLNPQHEAKGTTTGKTITSSVIQQKIEDAHNKAWENQVQQSNSDN